jgi:proliferating cell nuclear antigen
MRVTLPVGTLRDAVVPLAKVVNEAMFIYRPNEFVVSATTPDRVASMEVTIALAGETATSSIKETSIGASLTTLPSFLNILPRSDKVTLTGPPETDRVTVATNDSRYQSYPFLKESVRFRDVSEDTPENCVKAVFPSASAPLDRSLTAADLCSDSVTIETRCDDPVVRFSAVGDNDRMQHPVPLSHLDAFDAESCCVSYSLNRVLTMYDAVKSRAAQFSIAVDLASELVFTTSHSTRPITTELRLRPLTG